MNKTAMQELIHYMKTYFHLTDESLEMFDKSLEKEKKQILDARQDGKNVCFRKGKRKEITNDEYYNQTYNQNK